MEVSEEMVVVGMEISKGGAMALGRRGGDGMAV